MKKNHLALRLALTAFLFMFYIAVADTPAEKQNPVATDLAQQARDRLQQATTRQDFEEAASLYKAAIKADPKAYDMKLTLGWIYAEKLHNPEEAYPFLNDVVKHSPNDVNARKMLGLVCMQTGRNEKAVAEFRAASKLQPGDPWIEANLGRSLARIGDYGDANKKFDAVLKSDPTNPDALLGKAEVAAWEGHSETALEDLRALETQNPTNADVLTLMGDIHRWKWKLSDAKQDYQQALDIDPNDSAAQGGLKQVQVLGESELGAKGYYFEDTTHFLRESVGGNGRVHLADKAYLLGSGTYWHYHSPGGTLPDNTTVPAANIDRVDAQAGMEYHWTRWLETSALADMYAYLRQQQHPIWGGEGSAKLSPWSGFDIYTTVIGRQPFVSSIATVENHMKQDSIGNGVDLRIIGPLSVQNSFQYARVYGQPTVLTDSGGNPVTMIGNTWWEEKPQVSLHVLHVPDVYLRAEYDHLSYSHTNTTYWTPHNRNVISPVIDVNIPLFWGLSIVADARAPYVWDVPGRKWGYQFEGGPVLNIKNHLEIKASYYISYIPGDQGAWSGKGGQVSLTARF